MSRDGFALGAMTYPRQGFRGEPPVTIHSYESAKEFWETRRKRVLENNTRFVKTEHGYGIKLHDTVVVEYLPDGGYRLDSGGWKTITTRSRMNAYLPKGMGVWQSKGIWYVQTSGERFRRDDENVRGFEDGVILYTDGRVIGAGDPGKEKRFREQVKEYAKNFVDAIFEGKVAAPGNGDCWGCLFSPADGQKLPAKTRDHPMGTDHLNQHIKERYYVPSLAMKAVEKYGSRAALSVVAGFMGLTEKGGPKSWYKPGEFMYEQIRRAIQKWVALGVGAGELR